MTMNERPSQGDEPQSIPGDPLVVPASDAVDPLDTVDPLNTVDPLDTDPAGLGATGVGTGVNEPRDFPPPTVSDVPPHAASTEEGGSKLKAGALIAGAAAVANKVRQEAPKQVQRLREKRAEGRCVIVTQVEGRWRAIGPYKDSQAAESDVFKVGGDAHVVELVTDAAFFGTTEESRA
jgi:hypothetical protein